MTDQPSDIGLTVRQLHNAADLMDGLADEIIHEADAIEIIKIARRTTRTTAMQFALLASTVRALGDLPQPSQTSPETRRTGTYRENAGTFVYVARDRTGQIIYVGVTDDLFGRMAAHRRTSAWWDHKEIIAWEEWPDRASALRKEAILIRRHRPKFNRAGNPDVVTRYRTRGADQ